MSVFCVHVTALMAMWSLIFLLGTTTAQVLLPWEYIVVPNDHNDEEDRKLEFECYAQCFGLNPAQDGTKRTVAKVQPNCLRKVPNMRVYKLGDTKIYISNYKQNWLTAYSTCRKYSMDLLGQGLATWDEEFANKLIKYYEDKDAFWLGGTEQVDNKFRWSDTGADISASGRGAKLGPAPVPSTRCLEARLNGLEVTWNGANCLETRNFVCVMRKHCIASS